MPLVVWKLDRWDQIWPILTRAHRQTRIAQDPLRIAGGAFRPINAPPQTLNVHKSPFIEVANCKAGSLKLENEAELIAQGGQIVQGLDNQPRPDRTRFRFEV